MMANRELAREIIPGPMTLIDFDGEPQALFLQLAISFEPVARRRCRLNEHQPALPARLAGEKIVDRPQTVEDALGVVEPFDADEQDRVRGQGEPLAHRLAALLDRSLRGESRRRPFDRDRDRRGSRSPCRSW